MAIKWATVTKGLIWEATGIIILYVYIVLSTGDYKAAGNLAVGWPVIRVIMWYPYERLFKRVLRYYRSKDESRD
jgi:uncharacterized membrane protein